MAKGKIKIGNVEGNLVISKGQSGGVTAHTINEGPQSPKKSFWKLFWIIVGGLASIVTIFAYFDIYPFLKKQEKQHIQVSTKKVIPEIEKEKLTTVKKTKTMNENNEKETPISIGDVTGDVIISQNQTGGITAHTVYVNKPLPRELNDSDQKMLKSLDREYLISVTAIGSNESQKYGIQIIEFLNSNNYKTSLNYTGTKIPEPEPARYYLNIDSNSKTVYITIPKEGV